MYLDGVASMVADPPEAHSTTMQNTPICNPPLYIALTFEGMMQLNLISYLYLFIFFSLKDGENISKNLLKSSSCLEALVFKKIPHTRDTECLDVCEY